MASKKKTYNVGIIGYGWVATAHIAAINATKQARVTAVYSSRPLDSAELSAKWGGRITPYHDLDAMLADPDIDVVSICSYSNKHTEHYLRAAKAKKHIIVEKPFALSWAECLAMERAAKANKIKTCICFECRFSSQFLVTKSVIDQGLLGHVHYGEIDYLHGIGPWYGQYRWNIKKDGGGSSLLTAGCHALDALLLCMGGEVAEVTSYDTKSKSKYFTPYEYTTSSVTILKFKDGRIGKCAAIVDCIQPYYFHTYLVGSEGSLLDNKFHSTKLQTNKHQWSTLAMKMLDTGDVSDHPYLGQFQAFFDALDQGKDMPLTSLKDCMNTHRVIFAADKSAATGKSVKL
jgi:UDP-N-acetyl-2-amino-2-deoxyglucuronate dehydrogenase